MLLQQASSPVVATGWQLPPTALLLRYAATWSLAATRRSVLHIVHISVCVHGGHAACVGLHVAVAVGSLRDAVSSKRGRFPCCGCLLSSVCPRLQAIPTDVVDRAVNTLVEDGGNGRVATSIRPKAPLVQASARVEADALQHPSQSAVPDRGVQPPATTTAWARHAAAPATVHVAVAGIDGAGCGSEPKPCGSLRFAVNVIAAAVSPASATVSIVVHAGRYTASSCGALSFRSLVVTGAGSSVTTIDCGGSGGRVLATNASLSVSGVTFTGGLQHVAHDLNDRRSWWTSTGGGALSVVLPLTAAGAPCAVPQVQLRDVAFVDNAVTIAACLDSTATATGSGGVAASDGDWDAHSVVTAPVGGGAVSVVWSGEQGACAAVVIANCSFDGNEVRQTNASCATSGGPGGGVLVAVVGDDVADVSVQLAEISASGNAATGGNSRPAPPRAHVVVVVL